MWAQCPSGLDRLAVAAVLVALACSAQEPGHVPVANAGASAGGSAGAVSGAGGAGIDPGRKDMHRLNSFEYNATVQDVLGTSLQPAGAAWRGEELAGFDNIASVLGVDSLQYDRYFRAAQALAAEVMADASARGRFVACSLAEPGCLPADVRPRAPAVRAG